MKVQITKLPLEKAEFGKQVDGSLSLKATAFGGGDYKKFDKKVYNKVKSTTGAVPREQANLEAEGGETAYGPISGQSIPDHLKIIGKRHTEGGVPMNLPDDTFIFSDTAALKISDPAILAMFNRVPKKGGYTPAELAKPYDINKYKDILFDPDSGKLEKNTATIMIKNYIMKLGALALVQESMKGFPQGIPEMARPYMEANNIAEEDLIPELKEQAEAMAQQMSQQQQMPMDDGSMEQMPDNEMAEEQYPQQMPSGAPVASPEMLAQMQGQGMPPEAMMQQPTMKRGGYMGIPYAKAGLSKEPCPAGMVWDPVYGCVPEADRHMQKYSPDQIQDFFNRVRKSDGPTKDLYDNILRENPDYFTLPADEFILQQYKDNHIPVIQLENGTYGVDYMNLDNDQRQQKGVVDRNYLNESMKAYDKAGYPPDEWMEQILNQNDRNKLQNDRNLEKQIEFYKQLDNYQQQYEQNMQDCPCRKKVITPSGSMSQICVPCEQMPMAAYGMAMGGYDFPYDQSDMGSSNTPTYANGGLIKAQEGITITPEMRNEIDTQWSGDEARYLAYKRLENKLRTDPTFKQQLYDKYKNVIGDEGQYTSGNRGKSGYYSSLSSRDENFVLDQLLAQEKRNKILQAAGEKYNWRAKESGQKADTPNKYVNQKTLQFIQQHPELGLKEDDFKYGYIGQAAYRAYADLMKEIDPTGAAQHWAKQTGQADEMGNTTISGIDNASTDTTLEQYLYETEDKAPTAKKPQDKICKCTDPKTGQVSQVVIAADAICECPGMKSEEIPIPPRMPETPHFSIPAKLNMLRNAMMRTKPAATNAVLVGRAQVAPAYEEYQTKVDQALAAQNQLSNALMYGVSGASATKQAQLKDLLGKSLNASISSVADVASRNVDRQREANQQNATIDNTNMLANRSALKESLDAQALRKDTETANKNKKMYNTYQAWIDAYKEMAKTQQLAITTPQYAPSYDTGFIYSTGVEKPLTGEITEDELDAMTRRNQEKGIVDYKEARQLAIQEARLKRSRSGGAMAHGGYVLASNAFPFLL